MAKRYEYILILVIGFTGLILVTSSQQVSAVPIDGLWKLNANGEKADLNITVNPPDSGLITGTAHWFGKPPSGGSDPFTTNVIGFWDTTSGKIVFLSENKVVFDSTREPVVCNTVEKPDPSLVTELRDAGKNITKTLDKLETCHGRDMAFTGYLFGDNNPNTGIRQDKPMMMAGVLQLFGGGTTGAGASAVRNTFGWCATFEVDMCGTPLAKGSTINATSMLNTSETAK